jgi:hypothetical protein
MLADGRLHLSGISILHRHLTMANRDTLLKRASHKSKRQIEEPDVPPTIRKLLERPAKAKPTRAAELGPDRVANLSSEPPPTRPALVKPTAPARYKVEFTASVELRNKLQRLRALMRSSVPDGDLAAIIEEAVTEKLERLEAKRYGKTKAPRKSLEETEMSSNSRYIPAAVKRAVCARDGDQCAYIDPSGRRCTETEGLEFHHRHPHGRGGNRRPENLELRCRAHNIYQAERDYGMKLMEKYGVREPAPIYTFGNRDTRAAESSWH